VKIESAARHRGKRLFNKIGRFEPFATLSANGSYLRISLKKSAID
jgi:hypothetical protein